MAAKKTLSALSPSRAKDFLQCPKLFYYKHVLGIRTPGSQATVRGTVAHFAFEHIFNHPPDERTKETALAYVEPAFSMLLDPLRERSAVPQDSPEAHLREAEKRYRDLHETGSQTESALLTEAREIAAIVGEDERAEFLETVREVVVGWFSMESPHRFTPKDRERYVRARIGTATVHGYIDRLDSFPDKSGNERVFISDYKGLALDTPLPTPTGWTTMGRVRVGDLLIGSDGQPVTVREVTPEQRLDCYELTFDDGTTIIADSVHLWRLADGDTISTRELAARIATGAEVLLPGSPVLPTSPAAGTGDEQADALGTVDVLARSLRDVEFVHPLSTEFRALLAARRSSTAMRTAVLDAFAIDGVIRVRDEAVGDILGEISASLGLGGLTPIRSAGVLSVRIGGRHAGSPRSVAAVRSVPSVATRCVAVDSDDSLYLAGRGMVTTHNTGKKPSERFADEAFFQLEVYAAALKESDGLDTHQVRLIYTKEGTADGVLTKNITPAVMAATRKKIAAVWNGIERANREGVWATRQQKLCDWCHFKPICPAFHKELEGLLPEEIEDRLTRKD